MITDIKGMALLQPDVLIGASLETKTFGEEEHVVCPPSCYFGKKTVFFLIREDRWTERDNASSMSFQEGRG